MTRFLVRDGALDVVRAPSLAAARDYAEQEPAEAEPVLVAVVVDELPVGARELQEVSRVVDGWARGCACGAVLYSNEPIPDSTRCIACGSYEEAFAPEHRTFIDLDGPAGSPWVSVEDRLPDDDLAVLACAPGDDEPVWPAYVSTGDDGPRWYSAQGAEATAEGQVGWGPVTHWMPMPAPPGGAQ